MIRPLEYCENNGHLAASIETIDARILELLHLRKKYIAETKKIVDPNKTEFVNLTVINEQLQQLVETNQLLQNEQK